MNSAKKPAYQDLGQVQSAVITFGIVTCLLGLINLALAQMHAVAAFGFAELITSTLLIADMRYYRLDQILGFPIHGIPWSWGDNVVVTALTVSIVLSAAASYEALVNGVVLTAIPWLHVVLAFVAIAAIVTSNGPAPKN